ncbi:MAG: 2-oxoacid:acceptor oxidoreductase family protein [Clostridia bacterium]|nr:2-oxoacid:acceptor oxidoreductase family protein [Clostridia bacterium]
MTHELLSAGFGGQGVLLLGQLIAYAGLKEEKNVSWLPSYGPEMRGGTANCSVVVSTEEVGSPVVTSPDILVVMNRPSFEKYVDSVVPGGKMFVNSSLIDLKTDRTDIDVYYIPANQIADELGNLRVANMVMLGAVLEQTKIVSPETAIECLKASWGERRAHLIPINQEAMKKGAEASNK